MALEGLVGFEPTTPGLRVRSSMAEPATQGHEGRAAGVRDSVVLGQASPDNLPRKQELIAWRSVLARAPDCQSARAGRKIPVVDAMLRPRGQEVGRGVHQERRKSPRIADDTQQTWVGEDIRQLTRVAGGRPD